MDPLVIKFCTNKKILTLTQLFSGLCLNSVDVVSFRLVIDIGSWISITALVYPFFPLRVKGICSSEVIEPANIYILIFDVEEIQSKVVQIDRNKNVSPEFSVFWHKA